MEDEKWTDSLLHPIPSPSFATCHWNKGEANCMMHVKCFKWAKMWLTEKLKIHKYKCCVVIGQWVIWFDSERESRKTLSLRIFRGSFSRISLCLCDQRGTRPCITLGATHSFTTNTQCPIFVLTLSCQKFFFRTNKSL